VQGVAWSPEGDRLASVSHDRTLRLWDVATGRQLAVRHGHENTIREVAFSGDGAMIATASHDRTVRLWSGADARAVACLEGHQDAVRNVAFVPGPRVISFSAQIRYFGLEPRDEVPVLQGHGDRVLSLAFRPSGGLLASAAADGSVRLWDIPRRRATATLEAPGQGHTTVLFLAGDRLGVLAAGKLRLWRLDAEGIPGPAADHPLGARSATRTYRPEVVALGYEDGHVALFDVDAGVEIARRRLFAAPVARMATDPAGRSLAASSTAWDLATLDADTLEVRASTRLKGSISALAFSHDGRRIAATGTKGAILDAKTLGLDLTLRGQPPTIDAVAFSPDGTRLATGGGDMTVRIWDARTGEMVLTLLGPRYRVWSLAWSPDNQCIASGEGHWEDANSCIRLWQ
jgi:WD40 repeat protein